MDSAIFREVKIPDSDSISNNFCSSNSSASDMSVIKSFNLPFSQEVSTSLHQSLYLSMPKRGKEAIFFSTDSTVLLSLEGIASSLSLKPEIRSLSACSLLADLRSFQKELSSLIRSMPHSRIFLPKGCLSPGYSEKSFMFMVSTNLTF